MRKLHFRGQDARGLDLQFCWEFVFFRPFVEIGNSITIGLFLFPEQVHGVETETDHLTQILVRGINQTLEEYYE